MIPNTTTEVNSVLEVIYSRRSVRSYQVGHKIPDQDLRTILHAAGVAPSAWNLQPWKFLVVETQADKDKLLPIAYNQKQIMESSVTIAVLGDTEANHNAEIVYGRAAQEGLMPTEFKDRMVANINQAYEKGGERLGRDQAFLNASLAAMQLMIAAKALGYDSVPMSGFDAVRFSAEFQVPDRYVPVMLISIGIGAEPAKTSERMPLEDILFQHDQA